MLNSKKQTIFILVYALLATIICYITENIFHPEYMLIVLEKFFLFIIFPIFFGKIFKINFGMFGKINKKSFSYGIGFGILGALVIFLAYFFLRENISWEDIQNSLSQRGVNANTFIFVFAYVMFGNSLIEEYFFRGFVFHTLEQKNRSFGYIFNSLLFSVYHMSIFTGWFNWQITLLALFGLFLGAIFFSWLYKKTSGIWGAWIFHIIADLVILIVGYLEIFS